MQNLLSSSLLSSNLKIKKHITTVLPVVFYGRETCSPTIREERTVRMFENRVLRVFGPKGDEITREWRKLHNEELNELCSSLLLFG